MTREGAIVKDGDMHVVRVLGKNRDGLPSGVRCINPDAKPDEQILEKRFTHKQVFLPDQYAAGMKLLCYPDSITLSMNGYSQIGMEMCSRHGITEADYEAACAAILRKALRHLNQKFEGVRLQLASGASDMGVDRAINQVAREFNITPLGFSCPRFMLYVEDDDWPVYVAANKDDYADAFVRSVDLLVCTGGREQALKHDVLAACVYNKRLHFIDVLSHLSRTGWAPATIPDGKGGMKVENAAAAFGRNISFFNRDDSARAVPPGGDAWDAIFVDIQGVATEVCRSQLSTVRRYS